MSDAQPPAGWYADPQDAQQQRYWDGSTWTGHTAPGVAAPASAPTGDAPQTAAPLPTGTPAWQMPVGGQPGMPGMPVAKKSWYKRKGFLIPVAVVIVLIVIGAIFGGTGDASNAMEKAIKSDGQKQLQAEVSQNAPGATVDVGKVNCVKTGGTQTYSCLVDFTVTLDGKTTSFFQHVAGECDNHRQCLWHTTEDPQLSTGD